LRSIARLGAAVVLGGGLFLSLGGGQALAIVCSVAPKPVGAGAAAFFSEADDPDDPPVILNPSGQAQGGFVTIDLDGDYEGDVDVFLLPVTPALEDEFDIEVGELPRGAHNSGPGDNGCDGVGIDDLEACFGP